MATIDTTSDSRLEGMNASRANNATEMSESYFVTFTTNVTDPVDAINSSGYTIGQAHPIQTIFKLTGLSGIPLKGDEWMFELTWNDDQTLSASGATPAEFNALIDYGSWSFQRVVEKDKRPTPIGGTQAALDIQNTAGEKFDPPPLETITYPTVSIKVRSNTPDIDIIEDVGKINDTSFDIVGITCAPFTAMLADYKIVPVTDPQTGTVRYDNTFTFQLNYSRDQEDNAVIIGFQAQIANVGLNELLSGESKTQAIQDNNQQDVTVAQFLKGGAAADKGEVSRLANYLTYVINDLKDFSTYGLPTAYPSY